MFWLFCAAMAVIVSLAIFWPALRRRPADTGAEDPAQWDLRVYRDQLAGLERDVTRGILPEPEAARLRAEIGRKVIEADRTLKSRAGQSRGMLGANPFWALGVMATLLIGSFLFYDRFGAPDMPDMPLTGRIEAAQRSYDSRPTQTEAEAKAPPKPALNVDPKYTELVDQLRRAVAQRPDDVQGLTLLSDHESNLGNFKAAYAAQAKLIAAKGAQVTGDDHARLAALMTEAAGGQVTPEAEAELRIALTMDPRNGPARYMTGLLQAQIGRPDQTFPIWRSLLEEGPEGAPWVMAIRPVISDLAWLAGEPGYQPPASSQTSMPALDNDQLAAAGEMSDSDRNAMARDMVKRLEARLAQEGGTPVEWARLIASLGVIGEDAHAADILAEARTRFAGQPEALTILDEAAAKAGLDDNAKAGDTFPTPAPTLDAATIEAASDMTDADRQDMIATMVSGLESRLKAEGGTPAEWGRLITSYQVLGKTDQARQALQTARNAFANDANAQALLDAAATQAGLK